MVTRSMKRVVLSILESSREVVDAWNRSNRSNTPVNRVQMLKSLARLEKAVKRLDRISDA